LLEGLQYILLLPEAVWDGTRIMMIDAIHHSCYYFL
jgi:hypothetical protein